MAICRSALERQLALASAGEHRLHLPRPRGLLRPGAGRHFHHAPETFLQLSGSTDFDLPQERFRVLPFELCILPIRMPHREVHRSRPGVFRQLVFMFEDTGFAWHLKEGVLAGQDQATHVHPLRTRTTIESRRAIVYLSEIHAARASDAVERERTVQGLLLAYLALLHRELLRPSQPLSAISQRVQDCRHLVLRRLPDARLGVQALARTLGCSANHLSTCFAEETGSTLVGFIQRERLAVAQAMLADPACSIKVVAAAVGMPDASYFSRVFRARIGVTPRIFRQRCLRIGS